MFQRQVSEQKLICSYSGGQKVAVCTRRLVVTSG